MKQLTFILIIAFYSAILFPQDTLTALHYNLLYYGVNTSWCNSSNNNINNKDGYLKTIIDYAEPDIFTVNEISKSASIQNHLLDQVLNTNGRTHYKKANFIFQAISDIVNSLYYNSEKLALHSHTIAQNYIRDVDVYKLYYLSDELKAGDTTFIICVVAHLKASTGTTNVNKRKVMAENTMEYLEDFDDNNNYLLMGDFNIYTSSEPAYQEFINYTNTNLRFNDPVDKPGDWNNNYYFRHYHTQSTHTDDNGCASYGGMDDRFDFILISNKIKNGTDKVRYLPGSYRAIGQDGNRFNESLISSPTNTSVPGDVLHALYNNSDHLPVTLKLLVGDHVDIDKPESNFAVKVTNPFDDELHIQFKGNQIVGIRIQLIDLTGKIHIGKKVSGFNETVSLNTGSVSPGFYVLRIYSGDQVLVSKKVVKF